MKNNTITDFSVRLLLGLLLGLLPALARLPLGAAWKLGDAIGWLLYQRAKRECRNARINIRTCFADYTRDEQEALVRECMNSLGRTYTESGAVWFRPLHKTLSLITEVENEALLRDARQQGQGLIALTPHLGCWEILGLYLATQGATTILYKAPDNKELQQNLHRLRQKSGATLVAVGRQGIKTVYQALSRGEIVGILPDQIPKGGAGVEADFFNIPAQTLLLVNRLARKTGARVIFGAALRQQDKAVFKIKVLPAPAAIDDVDPRRAARALNEGIEACVDWAPGQYQWNYRRFSGYLADGSKRYHEQNPLAQKKPG
ncbi:MAG: lysophospholipid acyltransferase family protein [gamma proteobacterium symbiont of Bathyaustriella thionipta]|nr:lysophospholipid acyltransferase family protein [gamma proteobacterium symbiont of Bathyaustriella thionipta]